jgi:hypothetical protein
MLVGHSKVAFPLWSWHPDNRIARRAHQEFHWQLRLGILSFIQRPEGESGHTVVTVQGDYEAIRIGVVGVMGMLSQQPLNSDSASVACMEVAHEDDVVPIIGWAL